MLSIHLELQCFIKWTAVSEFTQSIQCIGWRSVNIYVNTNMIIVYWKTW